MIIKDFPGDFSAPDVTYTQSSPVAEGDQYKKGDAVDAWGCRFHNIYEGIIGEVKDPIVKEDDWSDSSNVHIPEEHLSFDIDEVNKQCKLKSDLFLIGAGVNPFERLQWIRGTESFFYDLADIPKGLYDFIEKMHDFNCRLLTKWAKTDVDALSISDDWGTQQSLLISPVQWEELFMPIYRDYIDIAHKHGKKMFMHSDGYTLSIIPKLIDLGLDAINTQIFCMGIDKLKQFKGKITFWGELDRQHLLPYGTIEDIDNAVESVYNNLWQDGGCIAQCEFGAGSRPENVYRMFEMWNRVTAH